MDPLVVALLMFAAFVALGIYHRKTVRRLHEWNATDSVRLERTLAELEKLTVVQAEWIDVQDRKIREQFDVISGVIKERDVWKNWYNEASYLYGNAHNMLMAELERVSTAAKIQVNPRIAAIRDMIDGKATVVSKESEKMSTPATPAPLGDRPEALREKANAQKTVVPSEEPAPARLA